MERVTYLAAGWLLEEGNGGKDDGLRRFGLYLLQKVHTTARGHPVAAPSSAATRRAHPPAWLFCWLRRCRQRWGSLALETGQHRACGLQRCGQVPTEHRQGRGYGVNLAAVALTGP